MLLILFILFLLHYLIFLYKNIMINQHLMLDRRQVVLLSLIFSFYNSNRILTVKQISNLSTLTILQLEKVNKNFLFLFVNLKVILNVKQIAAQSYVLIENDECFNSTRWRQTEIFQMAFFERSNDEVLMNICCHELLIFNPKS